MTKQKIAIIDYGSGNLRSAAKAFEHVVKENALDAEVIVTAHAEDIDQADRIVLPGQGAFGDCMKGLKSVNGMIEALESAVLSKGTPFLGICVGMQLMAARGLEHGSHAGLNWIEGEVVPITPKDPSLKIPHMGWNSLEFPTYSTDQNNRHFVLRSTETCENFYFVHSFMFQCLYNHHVLAMTNYGEPITAIVGKDNMIGVQFHPEKSQKAGLKLLSRFMEWKP
ncbi:MAG: imidazole glycerol phosphate synthase subunit HisH [Alphaproteobacteria bacterium]|nr:imidazole glycerol phosphate synthase subunit HisH [Alphaproteobacteria bacterium]